MSELISTTDIAKHIDQLERTGAAYHEKVHQVGVSCLAISARDGQIAPLNRFHSILSDRYKAAWKAYVRDNARDFMTMKHGEFAVRQETREARDVFLGKVAEFLQESFLETHLAPRVKREFTDSTVLKRVGSLIKAVDRELAANASAVAPDVRDVLDRFFDEIESTIKHHARRARAGRKSVRRAVQMPAAEAGAPAH